MKDTIYLKNHIYFMNMGCSNFHVALFGSRVKGLTTSPRTTHFPEGPLIGAPNVACQFLKMAMSLVVNFEIFLSILK